MLQVHDICKEYKIGASTQTALDHVSLSLRDSEFVAVLGPSGSGKTTLLNILGGLDRYDSGELVINGISTKKYSSRDWDAYRNHRVGFVFQNYHLIQHQSILSNVELTLAIGGMHVNERRKKAVAALKEVGLDDHMQKHPNQLSGGQMQRVAIARALVNDPDILLADEPTGALDRETSLQVMELLKKIAKDRLVVMVTHNAELAERYATRIISLKDGRIADDSDPPSAHDFTEDISGNAGRASMSFVTALSLSLQNLLTKKARTLLVAFAGSLGIIGIALILAISNGAATYMKKLEEDTLLSYPVTLTKTSFSFDMGSTGGGTPPENVEVYEAPVATQMMLRQTSNDLQSFREYMESEKNGIAEHAKAIEYAYDITPMIYRITLDGTRYRQVHPNGIFEQLGLSGSGFLSAYMTTDSFFSLPSDPDLYQDRYTIMEGRWPENSHELVLILSEDGAVPDLLLYATGLKDDTKLDDMVQNFAAGKTLSADQAQGVYRYADFTGIRFKRIRNFDCYAYDEEYGVWVNKTDDDSYMQSLAENGQDMEIVGVAKYKSDDENGALSTGLYYPSGLVDEMILEASEAKIVQEQLKNPETNVLTGKAFGDTGTPSFDLSNIFTIDEDVLKDSFSFDMSSLNSVSYTINPVNYVNLSSLVPSFSSEEFRQMLEESNTNLTSEMLSSVMNELFTAALVAYAAESPSGTADALLSNPEQLAAFLRNYIQSDAGQNLIRERLNDLFDEEAITNRMHESMPELSERYAAAITQAVTPAMRSMMNDLTGQMTSAMESVMEQNMDGLAEAFTEAVQPNMSETELKDLLSSLLPEAQTTYEDNLCAFGYADRNDPSRIVIYPNDFKSKYRILDCIAAYNETMVAEHTPEKVITHTDIAGTVLSSVTKILDAVSYMLIAFVSIALLVSSIMIGVITYISVLERRKEIGILRAIGASKSNISGIFHAETVITGLLAGLIGVGASLLLLIPVNNLIHSLTGSNDMQAVLTWSSMLGLITLSVALMFAGGLIPSMKAARSAPVETLRAE
ncbi:MAG: ABC transporter ATP-binding protein/permease [Lachnospiraceae bacterium]|nr:ABC transporter ATP-binding protein/permease [Lachnospiraceae bacterium]